MKVLEILKSKKFFFFQVVLILYIGFNLISGERGLISFFEKQSYEKKLFKKNTDLNIKLKSVEQKNKLLSNDIDLDYLETLYRTKLKFGKKDEILIKLN